MNWVNAIGIAGSFLFLIKILIHIYIKRKVDKKFYIGASGRFLNPVLFLPVFDDVIGRLTGLKKIANIIYFLSIGMIVVYVIGVNIQR